jgi:ribose transport system substrate-binding protein
VETHLRRQTILALLRESGTLDVDAVAARLNVSPNTIRNDFNALAAEGLLQRVRGGAALPSYGANPDFYSDAFQHRLQLNVEGKSVIGRWAAELVEDGDSILFDASTSAYMLAGYLQDRKNLTVVTNGVETARRLARNPTNSVLLLGGLLRSDGVPVTAIFADQTLRDLRIKTAFVSAAGVSREGGLTEGDIREAQIKSQMLDAADQVIAIIDSSKFGRPGLASFARLEQVHHVYTDSGISAEALEQLRAACSEVTICDAHGVTTLSPCRRESGHHAIGFANLSEQVPFAAEVRRSLERAAKEAGNVDLMVMDNELDEDRALAVADALVEARCDLIIEFQLHARLGAVLMEKFRQANIPVIAVDIPMIGATYFGADNYRAGAMAGAALGRWIRENWAGECDRVLVLEEARAGTGPAGRIQGQLDALASELGPIPESRIVRVESGNCAPVSEAGISVALQQLPDMHRIAILTFNDDAALGALAAARRLGRLDDVVLTGQGGDRSLRDELANPHSRIIGATTYHPERYGNALIRLALRILRGDPAPPAVNIEHSFIYAGADPAATGAPGPLPASVPVR